MKRIDDELDQILRSLDHMERAKAPAGFTNRLNQRLSFVRKDPFDRVYKLALAAMISLALLNGVLLLRESSSELNASEESLIVDTYYYETSLY